MPYDYQRYTADFILTHPEAAVFLAPGGMLFFEIGFDQGEDVSSLMKKQGYIDVNIIKDYSDLDRVVYGTKSVLM